ncbi:hypothetical protein FRB90_012435, partial [Tulasnella sp. 427]
MAAAGIPYPDNNSSINMVFYSMSVNSNQSSQNSTPYSQQAPTSGGGQGHQNQPDGGRGRGAGRGGGRSRSDEDASDRLSIRSSGSVKMSSDGGLRTFSFEPCNCSVRTRVTPTTAYCPVCNNACSQVLVEKDGKFIDFLGANEAIYEEPDANAANDANDLNDSQSTPPPIVIPPPVPAPQPSAVTTAPPPPLAIPPAAQLANDSDQQMIEVNTTQPASVMPRVTVRRLPIPPKPPVGPRPAPDHAMDIDFPDLSDAQSESPPGRVEQTDGGYGQGGYPVNFGHGHRIPNILFIEDTAYPPTKTIFSDEHSLPFVPPRRESPLPPTSNEALTTASPTSPLDPFIPQSAADNDELEKDSPPASATTAPTPPPATSTAVAPVAS